MSFSNNIDGSYFECDCTECTRLNCENCNSVNSNRCLMADSSSFLCILIWFASILNKNEAGQGATL